MSVAAEGLTEAILTILPPAELNKSLLLRQIRTVIRIQSYPDYGFFIAFFDILEYNIHTGELLDKLEFGEVKLCILFYMEPASRCYT